MTIARRFAAPIALALLLVTLIPLGVGLADAATARLAANCAVNVRARPTTLSTKRTVVATNTLVTVTGTVKGGAYMTTCHKAVSGSSWYAISAIGSRSVSSLFGVKVVYAASALFRSTTTTAGPAAGVAYGPTYGPSYGIDVSRWQGTIDFKKVRAAGKRFVIAKATEGRLYTDDAYARNRAGAIAAGLTFTAYHFAHPDGSRGDASLEADHFVAIAGLRHGMLIPALDVENGQTLGTVALQTWVKTWLNRVYTRLGVKAMIYTTPAFWQSYMGNSRWFSDNGYHVVWVAHWDTRTPATPASNWGARSWTFWQYSSCGRVPGIAGCVDLDRFGGYDLSKFKY